MPGTTDTGNHCDDGTTVITLPFSVTLYDQTFTQSTWRPTASSQFAPIQPLPTMPAVTGATCERCRIYRRPAHGLSRRRGCGIFTSITGTASNRIFNMEWRTSLLWRDHATPASILK